MFELSYRHINHKINAGLAYALEAMGEKFFFQATVYDQ